MIVVRNVFRLKFGAAKEARKLWTEGRALMEKTTSMPPRVLFDLTGPFYTFVLETTHPSVKAWESNTISLSAAKLSVRLPSPTSCINVLL